MMNKRNIENVSVVNFANKINKRGQVDSSVITMYRVLVIIIISVVILGVSSIVYSHHINIRDSEAMLLVREITDCVIDGAVVDLDKLREEKSVFEYCGFDGEVMEPFFVSVLIEVDGGVVLRIDGGDSSLLWVSEIFTGSAKTEAIKRYEPGYFKNGYDVIVLDGGVEKKGRISVEVVVNEE